MGGIRWDWVGGMCERGKGEGTEKSHHTCGTSPSFAQCQVHVSGKQQKSVMENSTWKKKLQKYILNRHNVTFCNIKTVL
jgi:hypothetical protein